MKYRKSELLLSNRLEIISMPLHRLRSCRIRRQPFVKQRARVSSAGRTTGPLTVVDSVEWLQKLLHLCQAQPLQSGHDPCHAIELAVHMEPHFCCNFFQWAACNMTDFVVNPVLMVHSCSIDASFGGHSVGIAEPVPVPAVIPSALWLGGAKSSNCALSLQPKRSIKHWAKIIFCSFPSVGEW